MIWSLKTGAFASVWSFSFLKSWNGLEQIGFCIARNMKRSRGTVPNENQFIVFDWIKCCLLWLEWRRLIHNLSHFFTSARNDEGNVIWKWIKENIGIKTQKMEMILNLFPNQPTIFHETVVHVTELHTRKYGQLSNILNYNKFIWIHLPKLNNSFPMAVPIRNCGFVLIKLLDVQRICSWRTQ